MSRLVEFFEGDDHRLSMSRLLCFLAFWPATWVIIHALDENTLGWYLGAFVLNYVGGKFGDALKRPAGKDCE